MRPNLTTPDSARPPARPAWGALGLLAFAVAAIMALVASSPATASTKRATVSVRTVEVGNPGNPSVGIVPFTDADLPVLRRRAADIGRLLAVGRRRQRPVRDRPSSRSRSSSGWRSSTPSIPSGTNRHNLYSPDRELGGVAEVRPDQQLPLGRARVEHYSVAYPEWADKPYGFANFLRAARFVNSLYNGRLLSKSASSAGGVAVVDYKVRLSTETERGMYDLPAASSTARPGPTSGASSSRARTSGSRRPTTTPPAAAPTPTGSTRPTPGSSATTSRRRPASTDPGSGDR